MQYRNIEDAGIAWGYLKDSILSGAPVAKRLWEQLRQFKADFVRKNASNVPSLVFPIDLSA